MADTKKIGQAPLPGIAVRLKELRTSKSLSQTEFAAKFGVAQNAYSRYETGSVPLPLVALDNLCKTYNVRREWLETGEGSMYVEEPVDAEIAKYFANVMGGAAPEFQRRLAAEMARMPPEAWEALEQFAVMDNSGLDKYEYRIYTYAVSIKAPPDGVPRKEVTTMERAQTTIRLPTELKEQLQKEADRRGDSFNETVIRLLLRGLESQSSRADPHTE